MPVAQHEGSTLTGGPTGVFSSGGFAELVQSVSISTTVAAEDVLAIGYSGVAAIRENIGTVDVSIEAILTKDGTSGAWHILSDYEAVVADMVLKTISSDLAYGKKCTVQSPYITGISFTFDVGASATTSWDFAADNTVWADQSTSIGFVDLDPSQYKDPVEFHEIYVTGISGVTSASFSASLGRDDIYILGQKTPFDRSVTKPYEVTVDIATLAGLPGDQLAKFVTDWTLAGDGTVDVRCGPVATSGAVPTDGLLDVAVGDNSSVSMSFRADNMSIRY